MRTVMKRTLAAICVLTVCLAMATAAEAKITGIGTPARKSYVSNTDERQVILYIGDSRVMFCTCGKKNSDARTNFAFCFVNGGNVGVINPKTGKLSSRVRGYIEKYRSRNPVIVFAFGLNGNSNPEKNAKRVIRTYNKWIKAYPELRFYVESIGPTKLSSGSYSNPNVIRLNKVLEEEFEPRGLWLDTYSYIVDNDIVNSTGKGLRDNYHYKWKTCKKELLKIRELVETDISAKKSDEAADSSAVQETRTDAQKQATASS